MKATLEDIAEIVVRSIRSGNKVLIFGVGGNASTASHFAAELAGKYEEYEDPLPVICLNDNTSIITAITNDFGWDQVFYRQIKGLGKKGDVVVGLSISGKGKYLVEAFRAACEKECIGILLNGGPPEEISETWFDYIVSVGSLDTPEVQETQLMWIHQLSGMIKKDLADAFVN